MGQKIVLLIVGLAVGIGVGYVVSGSNRPEVVPGKNAVALDTRIADFERVGAAKDERILLLEGQLENTENSHRDALAKARQLEEALDELKVASVVPEPEVVTPKGKATYADFQRALGKLGGAFQQHMFGDDKEIAEEIQALFRTASPEDVQKLLDKFKETTDLGQKTVMAHFLGMSHHPEALKMLEEIVRDKEQNLLERRVASHGLAFSGAESVKPLLRELAKEDPDRGTRANSAFGLDRMGDPEGVPLYFKATDEAFVEKDPLALVYLGGLVLMGDRALPAARERLKKYEDWQAKVQLISYIQSRKDKASLNLLTEIARDESQNDAVRKMAEGAIKTIEAAE